MVETVNGNLLDILIAAFGPAGFSGLLARLDRRYSFFFGWFGGSIGGLIGNLAGRVWIPAILCGVNLILAAIFWWLSRRRRKRAPRAYGAKSRALLAAVVARMREAAKPRPVFRPVPGGSRA